MGQLELTHPMIISARLLPAVRIGDVTISVNPYEVRGTDTGYRLYWRYVFDRPGAPMYEGTDVSQPWSLGLPGEHGAEPSADEYRAIMGTLLGFLAHAAEIYTGEVPADGWVFSPEIDRWASENSDEISIMSCEIGE